MCCSRFCELRNEKSHTKSQAFLVFALCMTWQCQKVFVHFAPFNVKQIEEGKQSEIKLSSFFWLSQQNIGKHILQSLSQILLFLGFQFASYLFKYFQKLQDLAKFSCGNFCWSCSQTLQTQTVSHGKGQMGSLNLQTQMKWHADGEKGNQNLIWTMTNSVELLGKNFNHFWKFHYILSLMMIFWFDFWFAILGTITTRTSWQKYTERGMRTSSTSKVWLQLLSPQQQIQQRTSINQISLQCQAIMQVWFKWLFKISIHSLVNQSINQFNYQLKFDYPCRKYIPISLKLLGKPQC